MLINRVGTFFILLGICLIVLYLLSDIAKTPTCSLLIGGGAFLAFGIFLWFKDPKKPGPPAERFRVLKGKKK